MQPCRRTVGQTRHLPLRDPVREPYQKMNPVCPSSCPARLVSIPPRAHCHDAALTSPSPVAEASLFGGLNLARIFELLIRRPQMYIVAAARGLEDEPLEAVLPIDGSEIDMSAASDVYSQEFTTVSQGTAMRRILTMANP